MSALFPQLIPLSCSPDLMRCVRKEHSVPRPRHQVGGLVKAECSALGVRAWDSRQVALGLGLLRLGSAWGTLATGCGHVPKGPLSRR